MGELQAIVPGQAVQGAAVVALHGQPIPPPGDEAALLWASVRDEIPVRGNDRVQPDANDGLI
jgi:hypothetical protein